MILSARTRIMAALRVWRGSNVVVAGGISGMKKVFHHSKQRKTNISKGVVAKKG